MILPCVFSVLVSQQNNCNSSLFIVCQFLNTNDFQISNYAVRHCISVTYMVNVSRIAVVVGLEAQYLPIDCHFMWPWCQIFVYQGIFTLICCIYSQPIMNIAKCIECITYTDVQSMIFMMYLANSKGIYDCTRKFPLIWDHLCHSRRAHESS